MRTSRLPLVLALVLGCGILAMAQDAKPDAKTANGANPADVKEEPKKASPVIAFVGADVYPVTSPVIRGGVVLVQDGKILKVGKDVEIPEGATRVDAKGKSVTPGFVAVSAANVGLRGAGGGGGGRGGPGGGQAAGATGRVADSLNPFDRNILFCLAAGITTASVEIGGGGGGRFGRDNLWELAADGDETNVCPCCGMTFLPTEPITPTQPAERTARRHAVLRMTYGDLTPMLVKENPFYHLPAGSFAGAMNRHQWRETIKRARQPGANRGPAGPGEDENQPQGFPGGQGRRVPAEVQQLAEKKIALRTDASSVTQMRDMIALAKELDYPLILEGVHEAWLIPDELKKGNVLTVLTPRSRRRPSPGKEDETGSSIETSGALEKAGVPFAVTPLSSSVSLDGIPGRDLTSIMLEAAFAVRGGCNEETALAALTLVPAKMLGLDKQIGSIEEGKAADLLILNGPPLDYRTIVDQAYVGGKVYYNRERDRIYQDFPNRY
jgi:imidazolonepropionase-like amidohydrolase